MCFIIIFIIFLTLEFYKNLLKPYKYLNIIIFIHCIMWKFLKNIYFAIMTFLGLLPKKKFTKTKTKPVTATEDITHLKKEIYLAAESLDDELNGVTEPNLHKCIGFCNKINKNTRNIIRLNTDIDSEEE